MRLVPFLKRDSNVINNFIEDEKIVGEKEKLRVRNMGVLFVGRLSKAKGFDDYLSLINATNSKKIEFKIVGEGVLSEKIPKKHNVHSLGQIPHRKIWEAYDQSKVFILPSYTEVFPMTILEAMARGLVILVSDIPGMREIIKEGRNGYIFPPGDIEKIKEIILYLKNNPKEIERISKNNLKDIWKFTAEKQVPKYIKVYEEVLKKK
jgi:glycosyltransferase involved in cell wall biosynthesis